MKFRFEDTVFVDDYANEVTTIIGLAHEVMHHKQNEKGRALKGDDLHNYQIAKLFMMKDPKYLWLQRSEPNAFCKLFVDKLLKVAHLCKMITTYKYRVDVGGRRAVVIGGRSVRYI